MIFRWLAEPRTRGIDIDAPSLVPLRRSLIRDKAFLRKIYQEWYDGIAAALPAGEGRILEIGSGGGFLDERVPGLITSEVQVGPHVGLVLDAQALPLRDESLRAIVMVDVLHHLPDSRRFFREAARCVRPGGRLVMIEPWVSPWSSLVYRSFHHEPFRPDAAEWEFPRGGPLSAANMALPWILFVRDRPQFEREFPEWRIVSIRPFMPFRYVISGGVSMRSLMPAWTFGVWRSVERALAPLNTQLGMFAQIVLERSDARTDARTDAGSPR
jgi:SAM-dependent methyltransferase